MFLIRLEILGCTAQQFVAYGNMSGHTEAIFEFQPLTPDITSEKVNFAKFFIENKCRNLDTCPTLRFFFLRLSDIELFFSCGLFSSTYEQRCYGVSASIEGIP